MATITEDYVSFETAKLLEEKGFQQLQNDSGYFTTEMVYGINVDKNGEHHFAHQYPIGVYNKDIYIAAPTLQMAMKWLREVHYLFIELKMSKNTFLWGYRVSTSNGRIVCFHANNFNKYEEACEEAIKYCLENLI